MITRSVSSASLAVALAAATLSAQTTLQINTGAAAGDQLGRSCTVIGDLDGDGQAELAFGAPYASVNGTSSGSIRVTNGRTGALLYAFHGLAAGDRLGESVASAGDVDGDGYPDIVGGAPLHDQNGTNSGMARVWSGRTGAVLYTWYGDQPGDWFGLSVDGAGDTNGDGRADVIVGAPYGKGSNTANVGEARIFSGLNGSVLRTFNSPSGVSVLGYSVSAAGDVNKDGKADVIVGAPQTTNTQQDQGRAYVYSGATGATLYTFQGATAGEYFGNSVDGGRDVNNDGWPDVIVGAPNADYAGGNSGSVFVYSGRTGAQIYNLKGTAAQDEMGRVCALAGDVDGDGWADVIGGARMKDQSVQNAGMARVWSGRTGATLFSVYGTLTDEQLGFSVGGGKDVNGDGLDDFIVGWPTFDTNNSNLDTGRVRVWSGTPLPITSYCTAGTSTSGCTATITTTGSPSLSSTAAFTLRANNVVNQKTGFLFYGRHGQAVPFGSGFLCVEPGYVRTPIQSTAGNATGTSCTGFLSVDLNQWLRQGNDPAVTAGATLFCQFYYRDVNASFSNAVYFTVAP